MEIPLKRLVEFAFPHVCGVSVRLSFRLWNSPTEKLWDYYFNDGILENVHNHERYTVQKIIERRVREHLLELCISRQFDLTRERMIEQLKLSLSSAKV
jgi:hypothetical protein